jgi:hypothetical protein
MTTPSTTAKPLWREMLHLSQIYSLWEYEDHHGYGAMIENMRDRIVSEEPEPTRCDPGTGESVGELELSRARWLQRQSIRAQLTAEAEKARRGE